MGKAKALFCALAIIVSQISFSLEIASAVTGTFNCGTSGTYSVLDGVLQGNNNTCTGALVLDASVTTINYATTFYSSTGLTSVSIPATTLSISYYAFAAYKSPALMEYVVDPNNPNYSSLDGVLYNKNRTRLIAYPYGKNVTSFSVPASVTTIDSYAFNCLTYTQTVNIGVNTTSLDGAFAPNGCSSSALQEVIVDSGNPNYSSLDGVLFNKTQTNLLNYPMGKSNTSYVVPNTVTTISRVSYNPFLTSITLPNGLRTIGGYVFESSKLTSVFIPDSVTSYYGNPFINSDSLTRIDVGENNLNYKSIDGVIYSKNGKTLLDYPGGKTETSFEIPSGVETIPSQWMWYNKYLRRITVPATVTSIGYGAIRYSSNSDTYLVFQGNSALTSITGNYAKNIIYCGSSNSAISNYATSNSITVKCQSQTPDFVISSGTLVGVKSTTITGYTISSNVAADYYTISPTLSSGLTFSTTTGLISGTPSVVAAATNYTVTGFNSLGSTARTFTLTVNERPPAFTLSRASLTRAAGSSGSFYSISSTGGTITSYSISPDISSTPGLSFSTVNGLITGVPTQEAAVQTYTITATNAGGTATQTFALTVAAAVPAFTLSPTSQTKSVGASTSFYTITSTGGAITSYSISPAISNTPGLSFSTSTGLISGTPTQVASSTTYTITATNAGGTATRTFALTVTLAAPAFTVSSSSVTREVGASTSFYSITSTGGAITSYSISPAIINTPGLSFSTSTGLISGTPTEVASSRTYTITATNASGTASQTFAITVIPASPVYTAEELAAQAAAQKAAEELAALQAAMELRRQQIEAAKVVVTDLLKSSKTISINQFQEAMYQPVSQKIIDRLNIEILKLPIELRLVEKEINSLIDALTFDQAFYDIEDRPTIDTYNLYGIPGMTARILSSVNDSILLIPSTKKTDLSVIRAIVLKYATVDQISNPLTKKSVTADQLVRIGLISTDNKNKTTILNALKRAPSTQIDTYEKLQKAISAELEVIKARADRLAAIKQKIRT